MANVNCSALTSTTSQDLCATMEGAGAGFAVFIQYLLLGLPILLITLVVLGGFGAIFWAISRVIGNSIHVRK